MSFCALHAPLVCHALPACIGGLHIPAVIDAILHDKHEFHNKYEEHKTRVIAEKKENDTHHSTAPDDPLPPELPVYSPDLRYNYKKPNYFYPSLSPYKTDSWQRRNSDGNILEPMTRIQQLRFGSLPPHVLNSELDDICLQQFHEAQQLKQILESKHETTPPKPLLNDTVATRDVVTKEEKDNQINETPGTSQVEKFHSKHVLSQETYDFINECKQNSKNIDSSTL